MSTKEDIQEAFDSYANHLKGKAFEDVSALCELVQNHISTLEAERRWIPVEEKLPENDDYALVAVTDFDEPLLAYFGQGSWWRAFCDGEEVSRHYGGVTHWMPLPKLPNAAE